jgi:hypothetical protein
VIATVEGLVGELRTVGVPVPVSEQEDALNALLHVDLGERAQVKAALGAALVKDAAHESAFSAIFDLYFAPHGRVDADVLDTVDEDGLRDLLLAALEANQPTLLRALVLPRDQSLSSSCLPSTKRLSTQLTRPTMMAPHNPAQNPFTWNGRFSFPATTLVSHSNRPFTTKAMSPSVKT